MLSPTAATRGIEPAYGLVEPHHPVLADRPEILIDPSLEQVRSYRRATASDFNLRAGLALTE